MKPEPWTSADDAVDDPGAGEDAERVERRLRQGQPPEERQEQHRAARCRPRRRPPSRRRTRAITTENDEPSSVANSIIPIMSAIPTGSFAPDSPSRIVPERPRISRLPKTENVTAGSVGASAAPIEPGQRPVEPEQPVAQPPRASPRSRTCRRRRARGSGPPSCRKRRRPMWRPPSKRIRIRATVVIRSTSTIESAFPSESGTSRPRSAGGRGRARRRERANRARQRAEQDREEERERDDEYDDGEIGGLVTREAYEARGRRGLTLSLPASHCRLMPTSDT